MRFIFPSDVIDPKRPDDAFEEQIKAFKNAGFPISIISIEYLQMGERRIYPPLEPNETVVYRGWMMNESEYQSFYDAVRSEGASPLTDVNTYLACHHLPNWYSLVEDLTPKTITFPPNADLKLELEALDWDAYFIKDYVKSLKTNSGSLLRSTEGVEQLVADMIKFRGEIEGGFCVRKVEDFIPDSELRYFVIRGKPYANNPEAIIPRVVADAVERIQSAFYTIDVARRSDGLDRIVEIGDGQVSDVVGWSPERLAGLWKTNV